MKNKAPWILGLSTGFHNGAACLCHGAEIVVAMQEERLTRIKRAPIRAGEQSLAVQYCLDSAGISLDNLDLIVDCTILQRPDDGETSIESIVGNSRSMPEVIRIPHHLGHALSAFCTSGFKQSTVLVVDGGGSFGWQLPECERAATINFDEKHVEHVSVYHFGRNDVTCVEKHAANKAYLESVGIGVMASFRSLGDMFAAVALQIFGQYLEAGKVMALAPFGQATTPPENFCTYDGRVFTFSDAVPHRFQHEDRWPSRSKEYADLAASVQRALETTLAAFVARLPKNERLCYAGGVALNSVANHSVLRLAGFRDLYVIPAAEDSGTAIGAAYYGLMKLSGKPHSRRLSSDSLGRAYSRTEVNAAMTRISEVETIPSRDVVNKCVDLLCDGYIVGWYQGGAEFGPRALGHRSILCDPRRHDAKEVLNSRVKHREAFRPFAPAVLAKHAKDWFVLDKPNLLTNFMLEVCQFRTPSDNPEVPAVKHVDGSGRLQTVTRRNNPRFCKLIQAFYERTGVPIIVNTSMNVMGEPIVESPRDALAVLLFTGIDYLIIENHVLRKAASFNSPLDLVPSRTTKAESVLAGNQMIGPFRISDSHLRQLTAIVSRIDDKSSLRQILRDALPDAQDEVEQTNIAHKLFRYTMIDFASRSMP